VWPIEGPVELMHRSARVIDKIVQRKAATQVPSLMERPLATKV
jgi:hypothetical protein